MSPAMKASFIGLLLLGLVVTETNAFVCSDLLSANVNLNLCLSISIPPSYNSCCNQLAVLYANINVYLNAGVAPSTICGCLPGILPAIPLIATVDAVLNVANTICLNADLAAFLRLCL